MKKTKTIQLQFLRFLAILLIMCWHMDLRQFRILPFTHEARWNAANSAVVFFFILSGFISGLTSYDKPVSCTAGNIVSFMWSKLKKLYPMYFFITLYSLIFYDLAGFISVHAWDELKNTTPSLVLNLLLLQSWTTNPRSFFLYSEVGWYVSTIMFLYLFNMPLRAVLGRIKQHKNSRLIYAGVIMLSLIGIFVYCYLLKDSDTEFTEYVFPPSRIGEYVCGMALGYLMYPYLYGDRDTVSETDSGSSVRTGLVFSALELLSVTLWIVFLYIPVTSWSFRIVQWLIPNLSVIIIFTLGKGYMSRLFRSDILRYLGDITYEFFLIHSMIIKAYVTVVPGNPLASRTGSAFSLLLCLLLSIMAAGMMSHKKLSLTGKPD